MTLNTLAAAVAFTALAGTVATAGAQAPPAESKGPAEKPAIVLVHGAYADGSSWGKVIPLLQARGYRVVSVQNPTTSLADDVTATERAIEQQPGSVVLVGHSWAGVVITQAGNNAKVKALVYVDASAPDSGQSISDAAAAGPAEPGASAGVKDGYGFLTLPEAAVRRYFAQDLTPAEQGVIAATQTPWYVGCLTDKVTRAAWHDKPSWWVIGEKDHMISPALQAKMAAAIGAKVTKLPTGHLAMLAAPKEVTAVILAAADAVHSGNPGGASAGGPDRVSLTPATLADPPAPTARPDALTGLTAEDVRGPAGVVPLAGQPAARLVIDPPLAAPLAQGRAVIPYRAENVRIVPVFGQAALDVSPRVGHVHVTVDDLPWHWLDASGEPLTITGLTPGPHKVLIELVNAAHQTLDYGVVRFDVPKRSLTKPDPAADGFRAAPTETYE